MVNQRYNKALNWVFVVSAVIIAIAGLKIAFDTVYFAGIEEGRRLERNRPQACPAVKTTQDHLDWWFKGDPKSKHAALKKACKGVRA